MSNEDNKWERLAQRPPQMFVGDKERDLIKQINQEIIERVVGQQILYYPISFEHTNYNVYGEAINKTYYPPVHIYCLVEWEGHTTETNNYGVDQKSSIVLHFHKRRLVEDQDLYVRTGDIVLYGNHYYELVSLNEPREIFGNTKYKIEISAKAIRAREGTFKTL